MIGLAATFVVTCLATAFACTAVKEDEDAHLVVSTLRLLGAMTGGIALFAAAVQGITLLAC